MNSNCKFGWGIDVNYHPQKTGNSKDQAKIFGIAISTMDGLRVVPFLSQNSTTKKKNCLMSAAHFPY